MNKPLIEACVDSYQSCVNAWKGGADRLELCAHLAIGGCTPSPFVFRQVMEDCDHIKANILIRPRFGDFLYTEKIGKEYRSWKRNWKIGRIVKKRRYWEDGLL